MLDTTPIQIEFLISSMFSIYMFKVYIIQILRENLIFRVIISRSRHGRRGKYQGGRPDPRPHSEGEGSGEG